VRELGLPILEVPVRGRARREGKKISWKDGLIALCPLLRYRFTD
jgi:hypothetical protein